MEDDDNNLDTHLCLACQLRMVGLDNYIRHKKVECPSLRRHLNYSHVNIMDDYSSMKSTEPSGTLFPARDLNTSQSDLAEDPSDDDYAIDCFFQSLELRHRLSVSSCSRQKLPSVDTILASPSLDVCTALSSSLRYSAATSDTEDWFNFVGDDVTNGFLLGSKSMDMDHLLPLSEKWNLNDTGVTNPSSEDNTCSLPTCNQAKDTASSDAIKDRPTVDEKFNCTVCNVTYQTRYSYARHLTTALHKRRAKGYCRREPELENTDRYSCSDKLADLLNKQKMFQCRACDFFCDKKSDLLKHLKGHRAASKSDKDSLRCVRCRYISRTADEMTRHIETSEHDAVMASTSRPCVVRRHRQSSETPGTAERRSEPVVCEYCSSQFKSRSYLAIHRRRHHTHERPFRCACCDKSFNNNGSLIAHNRTSRHLKRLGNEMGQNS